MQTVCRSVFENKLVPSSDLCAVLGPGSVRVVASTVVFGPLIHYSQRTVVGLNALRYDLPNPSTLFQQIAPLGAHRGSTENPLRSC